MHFVKLTSLVLLFPCLASAEGVPANADKIISDCRIALAEENGAQLSEIVRSVSGWDEIPDPGLRIATEFCLDLARIRLGDAFPDVSASTADIAPKSSDPALETYLARALDPDTDKAILAAEIADDGDFSPAPGEDRDALDDALLAYVRPLPAARAEANRTAYRALARISPDNEAYVGKVSQYTDAIHATGRSVAARLIKNTAEFDGSSWSRHPSSPRYQDIRDYVTLYLLEDGQGRRDLELFFNYTSSDGWLFVRSAEINIDGDMIRLPSVSWSRDNDTEIWEFAGFSGAAMDALALRIAESDRAVVRFNGDQFYEDYVITATEKHVIREMLLAYDYLEKQ